MRRNYDIIVIGGGHAGTEAAWAAANALVGKASGQQGRRKTTRHQGIEGPKRRARLRSVPRCLDPSMPSVALVTMDPSRIGTMSCNPAIGGLAKGQIVREVDALGGIMGLATDATGIQFRVLNMSKGPAVRGPRAQCDKYAYAAEVQRLIATRENLDVIAGTVDELLVEDGRIIGVRLPAGSGVVKVDRRLQRAATLREWNLVVAPEDPLPDGRGSSESGRAAPPIYPVRPARSDASPQPVELRTRSVVLTTGTFMRALMHTGPQKQRGGRVGEGSADGISAMLKRLGFELGRLKTGTPPRLAADSIDWSQLVEQHGDDAPIPFSELSPSQLPGRRFPVLEQTTCHATHTTAAAHDIIRDNLHRAPMYTGEVDAECGPRYCPSIEDKVVRFADRESHHVFLEPESLHTNEVYCNGISTSLPIDVQEQVVHAMPGCERARILKPGYAVEYDMVWPHQIDAMCMTKRVEGLFLAGQINGTSGYEEAGGQGLIAGLNAALFAAGQSLVRLGRDQAYIGVMLDDLVTKTPREPYRMFTSRAEYRLLLRSDNADVRLTPLAREHGLACDDRWGCYTARREAVQSLLTAMDNIRIEGKTIRELARRPEVTPAQVVRWLGTGHCDPVALERAIIEVQYEGYITRQQAEVKRQEGAERQRIPAELSYGGIAGLRSEASEALTRFRPQTLGQAGRLAGVNPADMTILAVAIRRHREMATTHN